MSIQNPRIVAVIGTAGRAFKNTPYLTHQLWMAMCDDLQSKVQPGDAFVSGGAAWSDHLAVHAFLQGWVTDLRLYFPAPFDRLQFQGPFKSSASTANWYHKLFRERTGVNSLEQLKQALDKGAFMSFEDSKEGHAGMFIRNTKVANVATAAVAYTFGAGSKPDDGGTLDTWEQIKSNDKIHVPLHNLIFK